MSKVTRFFGNMKLRNKLIASFCVLALVPVTALGVYAYGFMERAIVQRVEEGMENSVFQLKEKMDYQIRKYEQVLQYLMYNNQLATIFESTDASYYDIYYNMQEIYEPMLFSIRQMNAEITTIGIYTNNPLLRTRGTAVIQYTEPPQRVSAALGKHSIHWTIEGECLVGTGRVMQLHQQTPDSVAYIEIPMKKMLDFDVARVEQYGLAIAQQQELLYQTIHGDRSPESDIWLTRESDGGDEWLVVRQPMDEQGWEVVFCCPYAQLDIDLSSLTHMIWLAVLVGTVTLVVVSAITSNQITGRIKRLNRAMEQVEAGQMQVEAHATEKDEIGELFRHFNTMLRSLNDYIEINYKNKIVLREAELKMLQAQINPHFLYNTLSMINWMALDKDEVEISEALMRLSKFYRMILNRGNFTVCVRDEVENITCYLELQNKLHDNAYDTYLHFDEAMMDRRMIGMVLQPIAENAIEHGIDLLRDRRGELKITGRLEADAMVFTVSDNGPGMSQEKFEESLSHSAKGYGLKNVHDRLQIAYGASYGLSLLPSTQGTTIVIRVGSSAHALYAAHPGGGGGGG